MIKNYFPGGEHLYKCGHTWVLAIPEKDVKIGGQVPYVCSKCGAKHIAEHKRKGS